MTRAGRRAGVALKGGTLRGLDMPGFRSERIAEMIHRELAQRLRMDVKDERVTDISITRVQVSRDLKRAVVHYLPLGGGDIASGLQEGLDDAAKQLRGPIGRALRLRHAPELVFTADTDFEAAIRVTRLLDRLADERGEGDAP